MAFYFTKEARAEREKEKELMKQEREKIKQVEQKRKIEYYDWFTKHTRGFLDEVRNNGFNASWGFEVESEIDISTGLGGKQYNDIFVFDVPSLEGLAFDMESKHMLYFTCGTGYYGKYRDVNVTPNYKYTLIPFNQIFGVNVEINSQTVFTTETTKQNVIGRSIIGGMLAGEVGAIIGGTTGKTHLSLAGRIFGMYRYCTVRISANT